MRRYRILFCLWLVLLTGLWLFYNNNIGLYAAIGTIICLIFEGFVAFYVRRNITASLSATVSAVKGDTVFLNISVHNSAFLGTTKIAVSVLFQNLLTGKTDEKIAWLSVGGHASANTVFSIDSSRCGKVSFTATEISVFDSFGFFRLRKTVAEKTAVLILPQLFPISLSVGSQGVQDPESAEYSMIHSGNDPGETFALREYRPGDRLHDIHWKLSEKTNQLTVREYGLPINNTVLILLDNLSANAPRTEALCEILGETAVSLSAALCEIKLLHDIGWYDAEKKAISLCHITGEEELNEALGNILSAQPTKGNHNTVDFFCEQYDPSCFAHILIMTDKEQSEHTHGNTMFSYVVPPNDKKEGLYVEV